MNTLAIEPTITNGHGWTHYAVRFWDSEINEYVEIDCNDEQSMNNLTAAFVAAGHRAHPVAYKS